MLLRAGNFLVLAVVARIVSPAELGVFALAAAVQLLVNELAVLGVASAIARADLDVDQIAPTAVSISVVGGLVQSAAMVILAGPLAAFLGAPAAAGAIRVLAVCVALNGALAVPSAQLQRDFRQNVLFRASLVSLLPSSFLLILLAAMGEGALAFAWSRVAALATTGFVILRSLETNYLPGLAAQYVRPLIRFGFPLAMANVLSAVLLNVDYVFVARLMSPADVGLYMLAFQLCTLPAALLGSVLNSVALPAFSRLRRDDGDLRAALAYGVRTMGLIACPIATFMCVFATPLITTVYGAKWAPAGRVLSVLAIYGLVFVVGLLLANVIIATGRTGVLFWVQAVAIVTLVPALMAGVTLRGLVGAAAAHILVICLVTMPAYLVAIRRATGARPSQFLPAIFRPLAAAVVAALIARLAVAEVELDVAQLVVGFVVTASVYALITAPLLVQLLPVPPRWAGRLTVDVRRLTPEFRGGVSSGGKKQERSTNTDPTASRTGDTNGIGDPAGGAGSSGSQVSGAEPRPERDGEAASGLEAGRGR